MSTPTRPKSIPPQNDFDNVSAPANIKFVQAMHFTPSNRGRGGIYWIVLHAMDGNEDSQRAEGCANWFANKLSPKFEAPRASAHYCIDNDSIVQCVKDKDVAWHAPGANKFGIGIEHAGKGNQTASQWDDAFSRAMLLNSAGLVARLCLKYSIPPHFVTADELQRAHWGITTHAEVNKAFKGSTHTDPGAGFPQQWYLEQVKGAMQRISGMLSSVS